MSAEKVRRRVLATAHGHRWLSEHYRCDCGEHMLPDEWADHLLDKLNETVLDDLLDQLAVSTQGAHDHV